MTHRSWIQTTVGIVVATLLLSTIAAGVAVGQASPPSSYYGDAITEDGTEAPQDTKIVAVVEGGDRSFYNTTVSTTGEYNLDIDSSANSVTFRVGGASGPQADPPGTVTDIENGVERQDLTFPTGAFSSGGGDDGSSDDGSSDDGSSDDGSSDDGSSDDGSTEPEDDGNTDDGTPGFGVIAALIAILAAALTAYQEQD